MMKSIMAVMIATLLCAGAAFGGLFSEDPGELTASGQLWLPGEGDSDLFDLGYGATVSYREWLSFPWGVGMNLGAAQWQVDNGSEAYKWQQLTDYRGDATLLYFGPALYFSIIDWDNWNLTLETGVQYVYIDSNVKVSLEGESLTVDIDSSLLWHIGLEYEYMVGENLYLLGGAGYQMDLMPADTDYELGKLRDTYLHGAFFRMGAKFLF
jgi:hypothetical protein